MENKSRIHWVDGLRGLLLLLMFVYHLAFDLNFLGFAQIDVQKGIWLILLRVIQFGFLGLVGFSFYLSRKRSELSLFRKKQLRRFFVILSAAMVVTLVTYLIYPNETVWFGILHLIAVSVLVGTLVIDWPIAQGVLAVGAMIGGWVLAPMPVATQWLIPFGLTPEAFGSFDFYPILPWIAVPLGGMLTARLLDHFSLIRNPTTLKSAPLEFLGKHSLILYLIHQPILFGMLWVLGQL